MRISIFGSGYVGLVQAAIFADVGHQVICADIDAKKIDQLNRCEIPFYEPNLKALVQNGMNSGLLTFTTDNKKAVQDSEFLFICVGTPSNGDGSADLRYVMEVASGIATHMTNRKVVITKSTVPTGTTDKVLAYIKDILRSNGKDTLIEAASNPEFLKEGTAVADGQSPDRIIIGTESPQVLRDLRLMYQAFNRNRDKIMPMDTRSAELTKYASNAMLATKISFMNEMANIAEIVGADIEHVRQGMGSDPRIGYQFIYPGCGYGGSCFPKDITALQHLAAHHGRSAPILDAVHSTNELQKNKLGERVLSVLGPNLKDKTIAVWGLSFKPNTDDMREAPSRHLMESVWAAGGKIQAYDPVASHSCKEIYGEEKQLTLVDTKEEALENADVLVICTEWKAFWSPDFEQIISLLNQPVIIDGRNLYNPALMAELGVDYYGIGRGLSLSR